MQKIKIDLTFKCCRTKYSMRDPEKYDCFTKYKNDYVNIPKAESPHVGNTKVYKATTYVLSCIKNGCTKVKILKYSKNGTLLELQEISKSKEAIEYLNKIRPTAKEIAIRYPIKRVPFAKRIKPFYGKAISTQSTQQISLDGLIKGKVFFMPIKIVKAAKND